MMYTIDLALWNITPGLPSKPYVTADYNRANDNVNGFTNAIAWAADQGYSYIIVPKGEYALCYPNSIKITDSYITVDLNGSTFKEIYDSEAQSPYDTANRTVLRDYYAFPSNQVPGVAFKIEECTHTSLIKGIIIGDKADRSFAVPNEERKNEWTNGIQIGKGASYINVGKNTISYFMADGISFINSGVAEMVEFALGLSVSDINPNTGALMASTTNMVSKLLTIPAHIPPHQAFLIAGFGYTRATAINAKEVGVYYYNAAGAFIRGFSNQKIYKPITIVPGAAMFRFVFYNETNITKDMQIHLKFGLTPHHCTVEDNEIFGCHRGGITPGGNDLIIQNNILHDIGVEYLDGKPIFNDPTRYCINQEDSFGDNTLIRNNIMYNCFHGILCGAYFPTIENNRFYNCLGTAINLYILKKAVVTGNFIYKCGTSLGLMTAVFQNAHVTYRDNTIVGGNLLLNNGVGYHITAEGNMFEDVINLAYPDDDRCVFRGNHFRWSDTFSGAPMITINHIEDCTMEVKGARKLITLKAYEINRLDAKNTTIRVNTRNQLTVNENVNFYNSTFDSCQIDNLLYAMKERKVNIVKSKLTDTIVFIGNTNTNGQYPYTGLKDCTVILNTLTWLVQTNFNTSKGTVQIEDSQLTINNTAFLYLIKNDLTAGLPPLFTFALKRSRIIYTGPSKLTLGFYNSKGIIKSFISARNIFSNITLPARENVYVGYDPDKERDTVPTYGIFFTGQVIRNAYPAAGEPEYWLCLSRAGTPDDLPRTANNILWTAATVKALGDQVNAGGRVYTVTTAGTTGAAAPAWPTVEGNTVSDGTVVWTDSGYLAAFAAVGKI
ncbi:right-handed parallel beta-helix repeat-containing protein [Paenibacillus sepulcri]|uniref:Right-handed parallel beta-helix repeat-containing protein n=1 Tax=Paenibacillus sepulcri TaxID=359917 RepID=A0ABS7BYQ6_9BACL|nr:right-handed parallel beta-helix repeat-containing protein [Paenibacillus sepulcri]